MGEFTNMFCNHKRFLVIVLSCLTFSPANIAFAESTHDRPSAGGRSDGSEPIIAASGRVITIGRDRRTRGERMRRPPRKEPLNQLGYYFECHKRLYSYTLEGGVLPFSDKALILPTNTGVELLSMDDNMGYLRSYPFGKKLSTNGESKNYFLELEVPKNVDWYGRQQYDWVRLVYSVTRDNVHAKVYENYKLEDSVNFARMQFLNNPRGFGNLGVPQKSDETSLTRLQTKTMKLLENLPKEVEKRIQSKKLRKENKNTSLSLLGLLNACAKIGDQKIISAVIKAFNALDKQKTLWTTRLDPREFNRYLKSSK